MDIVVPPWNECIVYEHEVEEPPGVGGYLNSLEHTSMGSIEWRNTIKGSGSYGIGEFQLPLHSSQFHDSCHSRSSLLKRERRESNGPTVEHSIHYSRGSRRVRWSWLWYQPTLEDWAPTPMLSKFTFYSQETMTTVVTTISQFTSPTSSTTFFFFGTPSTNLIHQILSYEGIIRYY